jgi:ADP-ribose pyrophosphatase
VSGAPDPAFTPLGEEVVHRGHIATVVKGRFRAPDGKVFERDVVHHPGWVAVVPVDEEGRVVLVRQYRAPVGAWLLELPAGIRVVDGEPPAETARRELLEEAGLTCRELVELGTITNSPGISDETGVLFLATGLEDGEADPQGAEEQHLSVVRLHLDDLVALLGREVTDAKTVAGVLLAASHLA